MIVGSIVIVNKWKMCVGIEGLEGFIYGYDVIFLKLAIGYLKDRGIIEVVKYFESIEKLL